MNLQDPMAIYQKWREDEICRERKDIINELRGTVWGPSRHKAQNLSDGILEENCERRKAFWRYARQLYPFKKYFLDKRGKQVFEEILPPPFELTDSAFILDVLVGYMPPIPEDEVYIPEAPARVLSKYNKRT